ncbi:MAG: hypothetical protein KM310_00245 [Clostridiales bacterium]|nr:hypothetical protein [Clostridiales bacterium]
MLEWGMRVEMLTLENLRKIKERCERATPGPWVINLEHERQMMSGRRILPAIEGQNGVMVAPLLAPRYKNAYIRRHDAEFIAHARTDVPTLVAEVERLRELLRLIQDESETLKQAVEVAKGAGSTEVFDDIAKHVQAILWRLKNGR